jgi:hypothetical protein
MMSIIKDMLCPELIGNCYIVTANIAILAVPNGSIGSYTLVIKKYFILFIYLTSTQGKYVVTQPATPQGAIAQIPETHLIENYWS